MYTANPALYEKDFVGEGFQWVNCNDWEGCMLSYLRKGNNPDDSLLIVANFTPVVRENYRVGVPKGGVWKELFNSDAMEFGGSGVGNAGQVEAEKISWDNQDCSVNLRVPPLGILVFKVE